MRQFDVRGRAGDEEAASIPRGGSAHESAAGHRGVDDGNVLGEGGFEEGVKVFGAVDSREAVGVGEGGEDADFVGVFEGGSGRHG